MGLVHLNHLGVIPQNSITSGKSMKRSVQVLTTVPRKKGGGGSRNGALLVFCADSNALISSKCFVGKK